MVLMSPRDKNPLAVWTEDIVYLQQLSNNKLLAWNMIRKNNMQ